jgi:hypothetical protein
MNRRYNNAGRRRRDDSDNYKGNITNKPPKLIVVVDTIIFESLTNESTNCILECRDYFLILWTSRFHNQIHRSEIPFDAYINGLRNGMKPFRYLRMFLRDFHRPLLRLPVVIIDYERFFSLSSRGYDMCLSIDDYIIKQLYNEVALNTINVRKLNVDLRRFLQTWYSNNRNNTATTAPFTHTPVVGEYAVENIPNTILSLDDYGLNNLQSRQRFPRATTNTNTIITPFTRTRRSMAMGNTGAATVATTTTSKKKCVLVVSENFFSLYHNCESIVRFLDTCFLVVWSSNKTTVNKTNILNFRDVLRRSGVNISSILFGLDGNVKSMAALRRRVTDTELPFILVDMQIYDPGDENYTYISDFDFYININEYIVQMNRSTFVDIKRIISDINCYLASLNVNTAADVKSKMMKTVKEQPVGGENGGGYGDGVVTNDDYDDGEGVDNVLIKCSSRMGNIPDDWFQANKKTF